LLSSPKTTLLTIPLSKLRPLKRNPQYLSESQSEALKRSISRDGFLAPIVVRRAGPIYEILSGNHRVMAQRDVGGIEISCVLVHPCDDRRAARIAVNMNTVHGEPTPELLAPFLADLDTPTLKTLHLEGDLLRGIIEFDNTLKLRLDELRLPDAMNSGSGASAGIPNCVCKCGNRHVAAPKKSSRSKSAATATRASRKS